METVEIILVKDHPALGKEGTVVDMPEDNVKAWEDSGYAKIHGDGKKKTYTKKTKKAGSND